MKVPRRHAPEATRRNGNLKHVIIIIIIRLLGARGRRGSLRGRAGSGRGGGAVVLSVLVLVFCLPVEAGRLVVREVVAGQAVVDDDKVVRLAFDLGVGGLRL